MEAEVRASDRDWLIVQPTRITDGPATGTGKVIESGAGASAKISRADVAAFMLGELEHAEHTRRSIGMTG